MHCYCTHFTADRFPMTQPLAYSSNIEGSLSLKNRVAFYTNNPTIYHSQNYMQWFVDTLTYVYVLFTIIYGAGI